MTKHIAVNAGKLDTRGKAKKTMVWMRNIDKKTQRLPMRSENQAQRNRPAPFAMEMMPTSPAATAADTPVISCVMGAACEMIEMPAEVFRKSSAQRPYHCQVRMASGACRFCWNVASVEWQWVSIRRDGSSG